MSTEKFSRSPLSVAILLLTGSLAVHAVEEPKIEKIYVSGTRSESPQLPLATTITVITQEQIRLSGVTQVTDVLRAQAGIQIQNFDGGTRNTTISMRGFASNATNNALVLVDGRKLNNPNLTGPAFNTIALKDVERIEIVQGSAGVLYGDQAVGGVINIVTRRAVRGEIHGSVEALVGSDNLESYTASVNQGFANGLSYNVSAQKRVADNYRDNNQSDYENMFANLRYDFDRGHVFVEGQGVQDDLGLPGSLTDEQVAEDPRQTVDPANYANQESLLFRVGGAVELIKNWKLLAEYSDRDEDSISYYEGFGDPSAENLRFKQITPRIVGSIPTANGNAVVTIGYDNLAADYHVPDRFINIEQNIDGYYGQVIYPLTRALALTAGTRYSEVDDRDHTNNEVHRDSLSAYEMGANYQVNSAWRVFSRYAEGFRFANADENGFTLPEVDFLKAQTSDSVEAGFGWEGRGATATLTAYKMKVDNEILFDPSVGPYGANINLSESERQGVMIDADVTLSPQLTLRANYTFTDAEQTSGSFAGKQVPFVAEDTANLAIVFAFTAQLSTYVDANYTGSRYRVGDDANTQGKVGSITVFNANVLWSIRNLELGARVKNLTNEKYSDYQGYSLWTGNYLYPQAERHYEASIRYHF